MRIVKISSEHEAKDGRFGELKQLLVECDYRPGMIDSALSKARAESRKQSNLPNLPNGQTQFFLLLAGFGQQ
jgi:hypothetical protein